MATSPMIPKSKSSSRSITVSFDALLTAFPAMGGSLWREDAADGREMFTDKRARHRRARRPQHPA